MRDVRKRSTMHKRRVVFQRLHKVRLHRVFQQHSHRAVCFDIAAEHWGFVTAIRDNHVAQTLLEVFKVLRKAQDRHDLRRHSNVKPSFTRETVGDSAKVHVNLTQSTVVHI